MTRRTMLSHEVMHCAPLSFGGFGFRQPVEPRCSPRFPFVASLYTGGSSTSPSHPPPFDARPSPNRRGRRKDGSPLPPCVSPSPHHRCTHDATPHLRRPLWCVSRASPNFRESWRRVGFATDAHGVGVGAGSTSTARSRRSRWSVRLCGLAGDDRLPLPAAGLCCSPGGVRPSVGHVGDGVRGNPLPAALRLHTRSR